MAITDRRGRTVDGTDSSAVPGDPNSGLAIKTPCRAGTTANVTLSGLQTIDGITLVDGDRVLVHHQTTASENGIYEASSGNWTRAKDWDGTHEIVRGTAVLVTQGTTSALKTFSITAADPLTIGTSSVTIEELAPGPELAAVESISTTGLVARTAAAAWTTRTITGTSNEVTVTNGSGVSGNPTLSLPSALTFTGKTVTGGTFSSPTLVTPALGTPASGTLTNCTGLPVSTGVSGLGTGVATFLATPSSANLASAVTDETGSGALVFATSPTLVTPALGTPASGTLTNCTGLPVSTGVSGLGSGVATFLATPSSANLASAVSDETGSGALVFATSPALTTPNLGTPSAVTLTNATGLPVATGISGLGTGVATFLATPSSANLASAVSDETGSGALVFATSPALTTPNLGTPSAVTLTNATGLPVSTGISGLGTGVATFLATPSSANLASAVSDETGSGALVFATSPALTTPNLGTPSAATLTNATGLPLTTGVTGTLPVANGGTGDTGTAWTSYTPTLTAGSGSFTTTTITGFYKKIGKTVFLRVVLIITTNGTAASYIKITAPANFKASSALAGTRSDFATLGAVGDAATADIYVRLYDATYPGADGVVLSIGGVYEEA